MKVQLPSNTIISNMCVSDPIRNRQHVSMETKIKVRFMLRQNNNYQIFNEFGGFKFFRSNSGNVKSMM